MITGDWSVSSVLSHEVLEMFVDPNCNLWANDGKGVGLQLRGVRPGRGAQLHGQRRLGIELRHPVLVRPAGPGPTAQFDKLGHLTAAFSILKGGYVVYESAGKEQQKFGDEFPEWRKQMKTGPLARTRRRLAQAHYGG